MAVERSHHKREWLVRLGSTYSKLHIVELLSYDERITKKIQAVLLRIQTQKIENNLYRFSIMAAMECEARALNIT